jgi:hypothetical protein
MAWEIRYREADFQLVPAGNAFGSDWPEQPIQLVLGSYVPAAILAGSFVLYWFILLPFVFPATRPTTDQGRKRVQTLRDVHNFTICMYSGAASFGTAYYLWVNEQLDYESFMCTPVEDTWLRALSVSFTLSKVWEWADTAFIVWLGNRPPGFLHTYHHATTFWLFCFVMNQPGSEKIGMLLNGFVHFLMCAPQPRWLFCGRSPLNSKMCACAPVLRLRRRYSHYFRSWPKPLVPLITILQIVQLFCCLWVFTVNHTACPDATFSADPRAWSIEFISSYATVPVRMYACLHASWPVAQLAVRPPLYRWNGMITLQLSMWRPPRRELEMSMCACCRCSSSFSYVSSSIAGCALKANHRQRRKSDARA